MNFLDTVIPLLAGLILLFIGGETLVKGSSSLAIRIGISPLVIGLTVVAFGTSSPELSVSIKAALIGNGSIAIGNVIGSNIANIALILGISSVIRPLNIHANVIKREIPIMIFVTLLLIIFLLNNKLSFIEGVIFVFILVLYTVINIVLSRKENINIQSEYEEAIKTKLSLPLAITFVTIGLASLIYGADIFLKGAISLAKFLGVSDAIIGITVVAVGTSLPELFASIVASIKNEPDIAIGNVVGSNVFNILAILGISSTITDLHSNDISLINLLVMFATSLILFPVSYTQLKISRIEGFLLIIGYILYINTLL